MEQFTGLINSYLPEPHASLLNGMVLGQKLFVTDAFYEQLKIVGLIHIVVLSGSNISMLSAIIMNLIVKYAGYRLSTYITIICIVLFVWFVGAEPPVVRAAIMSVLSLIALIFGRKTLALYTLLVTSVIMILVNFEWLTSISFQLSVGATLGIILFGNVAQKENNNLLWNYFYDELRISVAAQVFTLPIIFWYFRTISLVAPLANILISWLVAPIMILGLCILAVGSCSWYAGFVLSWFAYGMIQIIIWFVEILSSLPYAQIKIV